MNLSCETPDLDQSKKLIRRLEEIGCTPYEAEGILSTYPITLISDSLKKIETSERIRQKARYLVKLLEGAVKPIIRQEALEREQEIHQIKKEQDEAEHLRLKALIQSLSPKRIEKMKDYIKKRLPVLPLPMITKERIATTLMDTEDVNTLAEDGRIIIALRLSLQTKSDREEESHDD